MSEILDYTEEEKDRLVDIQQYPERYLAYMNPMTVAKLLQDQKTQTLDLFVAELEKEFRDWEDMDATLTRIYRTAQRMKGEQSNQAQGVSDEST